MTIEVTQNEEISGKGRKGVVSTIRRKIANRGNAIIKERGRGGAV